MRIAKIKANYYVYQIGAKKVQKSDLLPVNLIVKLHIPKCIFEQKQVHKKKKQKHEERNSSHV